MKRALLIAVSIGILALASVLLSRLAPRFLEELAPRVEVGELPPAPDFKLQDIHGNTFHLGAHRGAVLVFTFWTSWNEVSLAQLGVLSEYSHSLQVEDLLVVAINSGETMEKTRPVLPSAMTPSAILLFDTLGEVGSLYGVGILPTTIVVDRGGLIGATRVGPLTSRELQQMVTPFR